MTSLAQQVYQTQSFQLREDEKATLRSLNTNETAAYTFLADKYSSRPECERWKQVARYLQPLAPQLGATGFGVGGSADSQLVSSYCLSRLTQLGSRDGMASYTWNGGAGSATGSFPAWSTSLPTDAHLLFASTLNFLTDIYPLLISLHYCDDSLPLTTQHKRKGAVVLHQARPHTLPPYYWLEVVEGEAGEVSGVGREWRVDPGRNNVEQCLALFVWVVKTRMDGRIGSIRLADRVMEGLADVCS